MRSLALVAAVFLAAATRLPSGDDLAYLAAGAAAIAAVAAVASLAGRLRRVTRPGALVATLGLLVTPSSATGVASGVPEWVVALAVVAALHVFFQDPETAAPFITSSGPLHGTVAKIVSAILRGLPFAAIVVVPMALERVLPARVRDAYELNTALAPLVPLVFVVTLLVALGAIRQLLGAPSGRASDADNAAAVPDAPVGVDAS